MKHWSGHERSSVIPAKAGMTEIFGVKELLIETRPVSRKIQPFRIISLYQTNLPGASPFLHCSLSDQSLSDIRMVLTIDQPEHIVFRSKSLSETVPVLP